MTSERSAWHPRWTLSALALITLGCPAPSDTVKKVAPGQIVVDVSEAGDLFSVRCGATASELVAQDLPNAIERCRSLASAPITLGTVRVNADTPFSQAFAAADLLHTTLQDPGSSVVIAQAGAAPVAFRPWDVCYATTPLAACTHVSLELLPTRVALKTWPGHAGPCASPRKKAAPYGQQGAATAATEKQTLACHVENTGNTTQQLSALGAHVKRATADVASCSIGTATVHHDVSWARAAAAAAELEAWTGETPALSASPTAERGLLGCEREAGD